LGTREIGNKSKAGNAKLGLRSVKLSDYVGRSNSLSDDAEGTVIARLGFPVEGLFDSGITDQDESTRLEVEIDDS
jgi:hypothetical protein